MDILSRESTLLSQGTVEAIMSQVGPNDLETIFKSEDFLVSDCLHQEADFTLVPDQQILQEGLFDYNGPDSTQQTILPQVQSVSTSVHPSIKDYPGPYDFNVELSKLAGDKAKWEHSMKLNKLFVVMDCKIPLKFKAKINEPGLYVRILPIFLAQDSFAEPVKRCPTHISTLEKSNKDFLHVEHVVRCHHQGATYQLNYESQRLSVVVPTEPPQPGCDWFTVVCSFMCKNSCGLGMNRRSTALIFTLERQTGEVVGRKLINIRICSCPRRDMQKEEMDLNVKYIENAKPENLLTTSSDKKILLKKPLKRLSKELVTVPVPRLYLKLLREAITVNANFRDLTEEEKISLGELNKFIQDRSVSNRRPICYGNNIGCHHPKHNGDKIEITIIKEQMKS